MFGFWDLGVRVQGLGFRGGDLGFGSRVLGLGFLALGIRPGRREAQPVLDERLKMFPEAISFAVQPVPQAPRVGLFSGGLGL